MKTRSRVTFLSTSAALALLTMGANAHAQTPRYTIKELAKPLASSYCVSSNAFINEAGDVAAPCAYKGGTRAITKLWCPFGGMAICFPYKSTATWNYELPVVWSANGTTRMLNTPGAKKPDRLTLGLTNTGEVLAAGQPITSADGMSRSAAEAWIWRGTAANGVNLPPPASVSPDYQMRQVTSGGRVLWSPPSKEKPVVVMPGGQVVAVPEMPPAALKPYVNPYDTYLNDQGMYIRARALIQSAPPQTLTQEVDLETWFYDGQAWTLMPVSPPDTVSMPTMSMNAKGHATYNEHGPYLWRPEQAATSQPLVQHFHYGAFQLPINDSDTIGGQMYSDAQPAGYHAVILINGIAHDLNTVTSSIPRNWVLQQVMSINNKGQIVVLVRDTSKADSDLNRSKMALLTPQ